MQLKKDTSVNLLEGNLLKVIIKLGYPMALSSLVQTVYNLVDAFWLGKLGASAVSAPIISFFIIFFLLAIGIGFSVAGTSLVAQYIGSKQKEKANRTAGNLLTYLMIFSFIFTALGLIFDKELFSLLATPDDAYEMTLSYYRIMMWGMPLIMPWFVYQSSMNGYGDTMSPLKISLLTAGINLVLDPVLIFGWAGFPAMGVDGAALATVITRGTASLIGMYFLFSGKKGIKLTLKSLKPDKKLRPLMFKVGFPAAVGMSGSALGFIVLMWIVNMFGTKVVSAYGIGMRVVHLFMLPTMGISAAVSAIVGQNLGAGYIDRAKQSVKKGIALMFYIIVPFVALTAVFGEELTRFFIPNEPVIHELGRVMFIISAPSVIFFGLSNVMEGAFQGSGHTVPVMVANISRIWIFRVPVVYLLAIVILGGPADIDASVGIWWGMVVSNFSSLLIVFIWFSRGTWAKARIEKKEETKSDIDIETAGETGEG